MARKNKNTIETLPFLADVRKKYLEMEAAFKRVEEIQESLLGSAQYDSVKVQAELNIHKMENASIALSDERDHLAYCINEYLDSFSYARNAIMSLDKAEYIRVVHLRDIMFFTWKKISEETGLSVQWVNKIYKRATEKLRIYDKNTET